VPAGGDYRVDTGSVTWVAHGTAFDLDRSPRASGSGDEVVGLALVDGLDIEGAGGGTPLDLNEGMSATVELSATGTADGPPVTGSTSSEVLARAWILANASLDEQLELPMGVLPGAASPGATATAGQSSSDVPPSASQANSAASEDPSGSATASPSGSPAQASARKPNSTPTPVRPGQTPNPTIAPYQTPAPTTPPAYSTPTATAIATATATAIATATETATATASSEPSSSASDALPSNDP